MNKNDLYNICFDLMRTWSFIVGTNTDVNGIDPERYEEVSKFIQYLINEDENFVKEINKRAHNEFQKLINEIYMAKGYHEMSEINSQIAKEDFHLEQEVAEYEMGETETKKRA